MEARVQSWASWLDKVLVEACPLPGTRDTRALKNSGALAAGQE